MSLVSSMLSRGINALSSSEGVPVEYNDGTWKELPSALWHEREAFTDFDEERGQEVIIHVATLTWPLHGPELTRGTLVRRTNQEYRVVGFPGDSQFRTATVEWRELIKSSADRGATR